MSDESLARSNQDPLPPDHQDTLSERMNQELLEIGLEGKLVALILKEEALKVVGYGSPVVLIPVDILLKSGVQDRLLDEESFTLGLRLTIEQLRPHGPTLLLAESLLSLARASRRYIGIENRLELALEAIDILKRCDVEFELGRAYLDLGVILKDSDLLYDALFVFNLAICMCSEQQDLGGVSAGYYQRANISRMLAQQYEALQMLDQADQHLPSLDSVRNWEKQILSERIFNLMELNRLEDALPHVNSWIALNDGMNTPHFIRGQINMRSGNHHQAMEDFCEASLLLSREILHRHSERFQRVDRALNRSIFESSFLAAVHEDEPLIALTLLELANTGGMGLPVEQAGEEKSFEAEAAQDLTKQAWQLSQQANQAFLSQDINSLAQFQEQADWLVSQWEYLSSQGSSIPGGIEDVRQAGSRLISALSPDAALIEIAETAETLWVIASSRDDITIRDTGLNAVDTALLAQSFRYECEGGFYNDSLDCLAKHLISPVNDLIQRKEKVYILPSPMLQGVPFHAMPWNGMPLIENHEVSYISSGIAQFTASSQPTAPISPLSRCSFFGVPHVAYKTIDELHGVLNEAQAVRGSFAELQESTLTSSGRRCISWSAGTRQHSPCRLPWRIPGKCPAALAPPPVRSPSICLRDHPGSAKLPVSRSQRLPDG